MQLFKVYRETKFMKQNHFSKYEKTENKKYRMNKLDVAGLLSKDTVSVYHAICIPNMNIIA